MQINGAQLAIAFSPKSSELQNASRTPITIDAKSTFEGTGEIPSPTKIQPQPNQQAITTKDVQQAQFIRLLVADSESSTQPESKVLPVNIQQYVQISKLSSESSFGLFDETI